MAKNFKSLPNERKGDEAQGGFRKPIRTSDFILRTLANGPDYISHMHSLYLDELFRLGVKNGKIVYTATGNISRRKSHPYKKIKSHPFELAVKALEREGKIEFDHETVSDNPIFKTWSLPPLRRWFRLATGTVVPPDNWRIVTPIIVVESVQKSPPPPPPPEEVKEVKKKVKKEAPVKPEPVKEVVVKPVEKKDLPVETRKKKTPAKTVKAETEKIDIEPDESGHITKEQFKEIIKQGKAIQDETKKKSSISRLQTILDQIPDDNADKSEVEYDIEAYDEIEREGLTPEEYADQKLEAFESIWDSWDAMKYIKAKG
jgi:hypothetical protein